MTSRVKKKILTLGVKEKDYHSDGDRVRERQASKDMRGEPTITMARIKPREYMPDVANPPGATILEMLAAKGMTQAELAQRMKRPANKVNEILPW